MQWLSDAEFMRQMNLLKTHFKAAPEDHRQAEREFSSLMRSACLKPGVLLSLVFMLLAGLVPLVFSAFVKFLWRQLPCASTLALSNFEKKARIPIFLALAAMSGFTAYATWFFCHAFED